MRGCADGITYSHRLDHARLSLQRQRVWDLMQDGHWHTLEEIAHATGSPEASVSARLRDLRKPRFGAHNVERRRVAGGLHEYRVA